MCPASGLTTSQARHAAGWDDNGAIHSRSLHLICKPHLQDLPGAQFLSRLAVLPVGVTLPPRLPIPSAELDSHKRACASAQQLPPGMVPVVPPREATGACDICNRDVEFDGVRLLCCARCGVTVHDTCYDATVHEPGTPWLCEACSAGIKEPPVCALCPVTGGAMRFCKQGAWAHAACLVWMPGTLMAPGEPPDISSVRLPQALAAALRVLLHSANRDAGYEPSVLQCFPLHACKYPMLCSEACRRASVQVSSGRYDLTCYLCEKQHGAALQCAAGNRCFKAFHPLCARLAGLPMQEVHSENKEAVKALRRNVRKHTGSNADFSLDRQGTSIASGIHLIAFCEKHACCALPATRPASLSVPPAAKAHFRSDGAVAARAYALLAL